MKWSVGIAGQKNMYDTYFSDQLSRRTIGMLLLTSPSPKTASPGRRATVFLNPCMIHLLS
jgi:hypothetical protein